MKKLNFRGILTNMLNKIPNKVIEKIYDLGICFGVTSWGIWYSDNKELERLRKDNASLGDKVKKSDQISENAVISSDLEKKDRLSESKRISDLETEFNLEKAKWADEKANLEVQISDLRRQVREESDNIYKEHINNRTAHDNSSHSDKNEGELIDVSLICQSTYENLNIPLFKLTFVILNWYICFSPLINCKIRELLWGKNSKPF